MPALHDGHFLCKGVDNWQIPPSANPTTRRQLVAQEHRTTMSILNDMATTTVWMYVLPYSLSSATDLLISLSLLQDVTLKTSRVTRDGTTTATVPVCAFYSNCQECRSRMPPLGTDSPTVNQAKVRWESSDPLPRSRSGYVFLLISPFLLRLTIQQTANPSPFVGVLIGQRPTSNCWLYSERQSGYLG